MDLRADKIVANSKALLFLLFTISLSAACILTVWIGYPRGIGTDGAFYALSGYNLFHGHGFTYSNVPNTFTWPMFSILIALVNVVINDLQICAHIVLIVAFAVGIFPFYYACKNLFNEKTARIAATLYFLNGFLLRLSARMIPESLMILMLLIAVYYTSNILRSVRLDQTPRKTDCFFTGLFLGLAYLVKPESFQYFVITFFLLVSISYHRKKLRKGFISLSILLFVFALVVAPQISFVHEVTGKWELTTYNRFFFRGLVEPLFSLSPGKGSVDPDMEYNYNAYIVRGPYTAERLQNDLSGFNVHVFEYSKSLLTIIGPASLVLALLFCFAKTDIQRYTKQYLVWMLFPMITLILWYTVKDKSFIVFVPFFLMIGAYYLNFVRTKYQGMPYFFYGLLLLIYLQSYTPIANQAPTNAVIGNHRKMGEWIRDNIRDMESMLIADRKPYITYFARGRYYRYNNVPDYESLISLLKEKKVNYLIVDDFYTQTKNPGVAELLNGKDRPDLRFVHAVQDSSWGKAILYKVNY